MTSHSRDGRRDIVLKLPSYGCREGRVPIHFDCRAFLALAAAAMPWPLAANAQQPRRLPVIGFGRLLDRYVRFELVVNLTTAKALGLKIPETFLVRADEVIE